MLDFVGEDVEDIRADKSDISENCLDTTTTEETKETGLKFMPDPVAI